MQSENRENVQVCNLCNLEHRDDRNENLSTSKEMKKKHFATFIN